MPDDQGPPHDRTGNRERLRLVGVLEPDHRGTAHLFGTAIKQLCSSVVPSDLHGVLVFEHE